MQTCGRWQRRDKMIQTFSKIWRFSAKRHSLLIKGLVSSFFRSVFGVTQLLAIIHTVYALTGNADTGDCMKRVVVLTLICLIGNFISSYVEQISTVEAGLFMAGDKRVSIGNVLRRVPLGFFNDTSAGQITATLTTTLTGVEMSACSALVRIISGVFGAFVMFLAMVLYDWRIGMIAGLGMVVYLFVVNWQMKISRTHSHILQTAQTRLAESTLRFLQGIKVTKAFSFHEGDRNLKRAIDESRDANIGLTGKSMPSQFAANLTIAVFESLILTAALYLGVGSLDNTVTKTVVLVIYSFILYSSLNQAGSTLSMIGILDHGMSEVQELENAGQLTCETPKQNPLSNEITLENVSFSYGKNEVLHNISTTIKPHSFTAVIGPSGSGKSTLCQLIPRFRDVSSGTIRIGGADIRHMETEELMKKISIVFQRVYLFEDSILNNIRFGKPDATLEEVRTAAKAAQCDAFIMALPDGYETLVGEGGSNLSGGEKQRISIARAILKDSPIIILDEATSALDAENEHEILQAIDELTRNKTVIMIAHRIKSVQKADHIIAIDGGRIVQEGTHEQLIGENGLYADFVAARQEAVGWKLAR